MMLGSKAELGAEGLAAPGPDDGPTAQAAPHPGPASRRRDARRAATRAEILDAAWALAQSRGLAELSLRELGAAVGMRAPSLYQYFPSKLAIYDAMFGQGMEGALAVMGAPYPPGDRRAVVLESGRRMLEYATADPVRAQLLFLRTIPGFEPSPSSYAPAQAINAVVQTLFVELGLVDPEAMDIWTALIGGLVTQQLSNDPGGDRWTRLIGRIVDMFLAEVAPDDPGPGSATRPRPPTPRRAPASTTPRTRRTPPAAVAPIPVTEHTPTPTPTEGT